MLHRSRPVLTVWALVFAGSAAACLSVQDPRAEPAPARGEQKHTLQQQRLVGNAACEPRECLPVTPGDELIVDFEDVRYDGVFVDGDSFKTRDPDWWQKFYGSPYVYPRGGDALTQSTQGAWRIQGTVLDWSGFGLWFGACTVDMSAYRGLSFDVAGDVGESGVLKLFINTAPNEPPESCRPNVGSCDSEKGDCKQPMKLIRVEQASKNVEVLFAEATGGAPLPNPDPAQILQFHFGFDWLDFQGQKHAPYRVDVTLDNFRLLP